MSDRLTEIRSRWQYLADVPMKSNLDYARLGEQAYGDMAVLFELLEAAQRPPLGYLVLSQRTDLSFAYVPEDRVYRKRAEAAEAQRSSARLKAEFPSRGAHRAFILAEVREVQP
jgi:hypothetical protein